MKVDVESCGSCPLYEWWHVARSGRGIEALSDRSPAPAAAEAILHHRSRIFERRMKDLAQEGEPSSEQLRRVRVAARRGAVALDAFAEIAGGARVRPLRRLMGRVRRRAGRIRDLELQRTVLAEAAPQAGVGERRAIEYLIGRLSNEIERGRCALNERLPDDRKRARRLRGRVLLAVAQRGEHAPLGDLGGIGRAELGRVVSALAAAGRGDLEQVHDLHRYRIAMRQVRYAVELFGPYVDPQGSDEVLPTLVNLQRAIGAVSDVQALLLTLENEAERLERREAAGDHDAPALRAGVAGLIDRYTTVRHQRQAEALAAIGDAKDAALLDQLRKLAAPPEPRAPVVSLTGAGNGSANKPSGGPAGGSGPATDPRKRLAALDIGTNSVRLAVVEAHPDGSYRLIDDEKETTRLGHGLVTTGRLSAEAMERSAVAIARMAKIAAGFGVPRDGIRIVGTSAVREATNRDEFLKLITERAGVEAEVLSEEDEGRLAFLSVAHSFDLSGMNSAVVDIGGGSTEIVLAAGGVIEEVYSLPLGAVRLTEQFGGPERSSVERFKEMRGHIRRMLRKRVGRPRLAPQLVVGTGGTFAALGTMVMLREGGGGAGERGDGVRGADGMLLWDRGVPGFEASRPQARHLIEQIRRMPVRERSGVPGLRAERADIIIAGLAIAERVLKHLGANAVRVHDRGVRDGLIITMVAREFQMPATHGGRAADPMRAVRRLARSCSYEAAHSEHVTGLALSIHEQLAASVAGADGDGTAEPWRDPASRRLLEAAGILHDIGYLVNYTKHHKHSYHLIVHSDLAGAGPFSRREIEIIANVARYHRQAEPKMGHPAFAAMPKADRKLGRQLAAILRVADGLDRTHMQAIERVRVDRRDGRVVFRVLAAEDPSTDLWGAERKARLFEKVFGARPAFVWEQAVAATLPLRGAGGRRMGGVDGPQPRSESA